MKPLDEKHILDTMIILVDSREQPSDRAKKRYAQFGVPYHRATLSYGDYTYNCQLPDGAWLYDESSTVSGHLVIERKMSLDELAMCFGTERPRFEREFQRATDSGAKIILMVENANWENLMNGKYRSKLHPNAFLASITAWSVRYNMVPVMCKEETSGLLIKEFLFRDLKERIEQGEFDGSG